MPVTPFQPNPAGAPGALPGGLDALSVGQSIFSHPDVPETPVVDGYSQIAFIGHGGFGNVWRASRNSDGALVALKIPHQTDPETAERLDLEAEALQTLDHPHIVRLLEVTASAGGSPVLVMELIEGPSLTDRLPDGGFEFDHALQIFLPVLDAVAHAHSRGIVHRDLKPSNILLAGDGTPKVSDFGLAQSLKDLRVAFSMTRSGMLAGTVEYLAPERYEPGSKAAAAADIFALGIILYEILTGRPPRGSWPPLSQVKRLDVRLDELLSEAIDPDPAKRLSSAASFRKRLEEIRDSRPRFAGTPLVTRPVRYADAIWTIAGLYFLAAGFCSLLSINNTDVPAVFDLTFHHTKLLGGFWALWILTIGMGALWTWQAFRLWKFRKISLREALPSPFGLRLGSSGGTAVLVALTQLLCAGAPLAYMVWIYSQVWVWATPATPVWEHGLAITRWGSDTPITAWTWDPSNFFNGGSYWIREMQPGIAPGTWRLHDRQSYFIFTQSLAMALGAAGICAGLITTCLAAISEWRRRHAVRLLLFLSAACVTGFSLSESVRFEEAIRTSDRDDVTLINARLHGERVKEAGKVLNSIFDAIVRNGAELPAGTAGAFTASVSCGHAGSMDRADFLRHLEAQRRQSATPGRIMESVCCSLVRLGDGGSYEWRFTWENYTTPLTAPARGEFCRLSCSGIISHSQQGGFISAWELESTPLYSGMDRISGADEAGAWLTSFLQSLSTEGCPGLESYFLPTVLAIESSDSRRYSPSGREITAAAFRTSRAAWSVLTLSPVTSPALLRLPGTRWELTCDLRQAGTRRDGSSPPSGHLHWQIELVFTDGRWQALRIRL